MARPEIPLGQPYEIVARNREGREFGRSVVVFPTTLRELQRDGYIRDGEQVQVDADHILRRFVSGETTYIRSEMRPSANADKAAERLSKDLEVIAALSPEKLAAFLAKAQELQAKATGQ